jgi:5-methylcytosine-specific restriction endonuclease McrA
MKGFSEKYITKIEKNLKRIARIVSRPADVGFQGKRERWIGVNEKPELFINDKRNYYREVYLKSQHWFSLRKKKLKQNPVCERCGSKKRVEPNHIQYRNLYDVNLKDLITLCRRCHRKEHNMR